MAVIDQLMILADAYAEAFSAHEQQQDQGTRLTEISAAFDAMHSAREALALALHTALPTPADTGPIIP